MSSVQPRLLFILLLIPFLTGIILFKGSGHNVIKLEHFENGWVGVETIIKKDIDLEKMVFGCSSVLLIERMPDSGKYIIKKGNAPFIWRKKAPIAYTFRPVCEPEIVYKDDAITCTVKQDFILSKYGEEVSVISVSTDFLLDQETGRIKVVSA